MLRHSHPSKFVLLTLMCVFVASCASSPSIPVVANCPRFPDPPPSLMAPAQAPNALSELESNLQILLDDAKPTPLR